MKKLPMLMSCRRLALCTCTLAAGLMQIAVPAGAALQITSPAVTIAALEARKACAMASQTAAMVQVDSTTLANLERLKALCDAAAGKPVPPREWPEEIQPQDGLPYGAKGLFDAQNLSEGMKALIECRQLAEKRAAEGKASPTLPEIKTVAR